jgi:hypothetical protein
MIACFLYVFSYAIDRVATDTHESHQSRGEDEQDLVSSIYFHRVNLFSKLRFLLVLVSDGLAVVLDGNNNNISGFSGSF